MIVDYSTGSTYGIPKIPLEFFEMIHNVSEYLLLDDKHDIGRFSYFNRTDYYWKGQYSPDHPSPLHHWYLGWIGMLFAQIGAIAMKGLEVADTYQKVQRGDMSEIDDEVLKMFEEPMTLDDYKVSVSDIPLESPPTQASLGYVNNSSLKVPRIKLRL